MCTQGYKCPLGRINDITYMKLLSKESGVQKRLLNVFPTSLFLAKNTALIFYILPLP